MSFSKNIKISLLIVGMLQLGSNNSYGQPEKQSTNKESIKLVAVLNSDATVYDKAMACRQLAIVADKTAVPTLASLLSNPKLATYARTALEAIPDVTADTALINALKKTKGELLVGIIHSLGKRRSEAAISDLSKLLKSNDKLVTHAAARALGYIGTKDSANILLQALSESEKDFSPAVATGCQICAGKLEINNKALAIKIYKTIIKSVLPKHQVLAATHRLIVIGGKAELPLLGGLLLSKDKAQFRFGLQVARELGENATGLLIVSFRQSSAARQELLVIAMSDIGSKKSLPVIFKAAKSSDNNVRLQAILALSRFDDPSCISVLLDASLDVDQNISQTAQTALASLSSNKMTAIILKLLDSDHSKMLQVAVKLSGQRSITSATPALLKLIEHKDASLRIFAIDSLGSTIGNDDLPKLISLSIKSKDSSQKIAAQKALKNACARLPQQKTTGQLATAMSDVSLEVKVMLLEQIAAVGGKAALKIVVAAANDKNEIVQDTATRLLGKWITADVAPELLKLAKSIKTPKYKIRVLRGYIRAARQLKMNNQQRLTICKNAMNIADRSNEKVLVLQVLGRINATQAMSMAVESLHDKDLQQSAILAILSIADKTVSTSPMVVEKHAERVIKITKNKNIVAMAKALQVRAREQIAYQKSKIQKDEKGFVKLFNKKSLEGWEGNLKMFQVIDQAIVGGSLKDRIPRNEFLCTKKVYGDFELRLQFKIIGKGANAGVQFRSKRIPNHHEVSGYQADLGDNWWGCLYDESRRRKVLAGPPAKKRTEPIRREKWNDYRILCQGSRIQLWINGVQTVDYTEKDPKISTTGIIGLQVHSGGPMQAWYRNIRIKELSQK